MSKSFGVFGIISVEKDYCLCSICYFSGKDPDDQKFGSVSKPSHSLYTFLQGPHLKEEYWALDLEID